MQFAGNSNIIESIECGTLAHSQYLETLHFYDGKALVVSENAMALYSSADAVTDPLGNGLMAMVEYPQTFSLGDIPKPWVIEHRSGFIGLSNDHVILVVPDAIRLYANKNDALRNQDIIAELLL